MSIEWFPGHMAAALEAASEQMGRTDVVIELLDARVPLASCNPAINAVRRKAQRPALKVLNKSDLADPKQTREWLAYYNSQPQTRAIALSAKTPREAARIPKECLLLAPGRGTIAKPLRMMILGIPNVGKSTLMNTLLRRHVAKVGNEPGVTKTPIRHEIKVGMTLIDTAGMLWPRMAEDTALKLAATHSVGPAAYDHQTVAAALGDCLLALYPEALHSRYETAAAKLDGHGLLAHIAAQRSLVIKGGLPDLQRASLVLLNDFRSGALGPMTLEVPLQEKSA